MYAAPPPPPPHHQQSMMSPPPMRQSPYPPSPFDPHSRQSLEDVGDTERAMGWHGSNQRASMSDVKLTGGGHHYDSDDDDMLMVPQEQRKRRTCMDKVCCGCCTCYPRWLRYICCVIFLLVIALAIVIGVLAATFKVPDVSMNGLEGEPQVSMTGETVNMNFTLAISVDNPNVEGITFEKIEAKAYYPNHHDTQIGGGELDNVHINKQAVTNISFPFNLKVDAADDSSKAIMSDLLSKCGMTGGEAQQITIDYDVIPTVKFGVIPISFTISNHANFDCPVSNLLSSGADGLASLIPGGVSPPAGA
ncbi:hypothetical protein O0I10_006995 [Lichtheimia ornata]|uniref:Late embryogenesis abundant protein LEA-2 subgroup domain-containing protein n=1 Tax=Lichtheimia ornata TaxID=688661 RepID=A0AAD7V1Q7_9FUNG|nr:uncharacterized protein O0I10_006995 [Lichtheimia ornata]KAJ8657179.1 hypothetical protein O0I10_006995 [Lichtheimia ornata]